MTPTYYERVSRTVAWRDGNKMARARLAREIGYRFEEQQEYRQCVARIRTQANPLQELWDFVEQKIDESAEADLSLRWEGGY